MGKLKVYELAKEMNLTNQEMIEKLKNIGVEGFSITSKCDTGALVGMFTGTTGKEAYNCYSKNGSVKTGNWAGGLFGSGAVIMRACYSVANVEGNQFVGLLQGSGSGDFINCFASLFLPSAIKTRT